MENIIENSHQLTPQKATVHSEVLKNLLEQIEAIDFEAKANPKQIENFKLTNKHYTVLAIESILNLAKRNNWGLCKNLNKIYTFNGEYWKQIELEDLQNFLGKAAEKMGVPIFSAKYHRFKEELYKQFISSASLPSPKADLDTVLINLQNGTLEINNNGTKLRRFKRNDFISYQLQFKHDTKAKATIFKEYLNKVLPDESCQKILAEYLGYVFIKNGSKRFKAEKALVLYGSGANGKSVFFDIVNAMLGIENVCHYSVQNITEEKGFYRSKLGGKLVNYSSEMGKKIESDCFKKLASGEPVEAAEKYGQPFTMEQYAKLIFNTNELPKDIEHTNAFFRRFLIIPFTVTIPENDRDPHLANKIIECELSGVLNWALSGLDRLLKQGKFTYSEAVEKELEKFKNESDSVKLFLDENGYESTPTSHIPLKKLYSDYRSYCIEYGYRWLNYKNFQQRLTHHNVNIDKINIGKVVYLM